MKSYTTATLSCVYCMIGGDELRKTIAYGLIMIIINKKKENKQI